MKRSLRRWQLILFAVACLNWMTVAAAAAPAAAAPAADSSDAETDEAEDAAPAAEVATGAVTVSKNEALRDGPCDGDGGGNSSSYVSNVSNGGGGGGGEETTVAPSRSTTTATNARADPTAAATANTKGNEGRAAAVDGLRNRVMRLTNELGKAEASLAIARQNEQKLTLLEREKNCYVKSASARVLRLVDNVQHVENSLAVDTSRERQVQTQLARTNRLVNRSARRLQIIRRLLAGAEVGLVNMESNWKLNGCRRPEPKKQR